MTARGVLFGVTATTADKLAAAASDDERRAVVEQLEEVWDEEHLAETDKAWDALHRALSDGSLDPEDDPLPLARAIVGSGNLMEGDEYFISLVGPKDVQEVAKALLELDRVAFERRYFRLVPKTYSPNYGKQDCEYSWGWLQGVVQLYARAAREGRAVVFTVSS